MLRDALGLEKVTLVPRGMDINDRWRGLVREVGYADDLFYIQHPPLEYLRYITPWIIALVRDPRDIAISMAYYALREEADLHRIEISWQMPGIPREASEDEMLAYFKEHGLNLPWWRSYMAYANRIPHIIVRYEDLVQDTEKVLSKTLESLGHPLPRGKVAGIVQARSFESFSKGRERGVEDKSHHYRKGVVGDWMNHFSPEENARFCDRYERYMRHFGYDIPIRHV
jgi:hypothetical protein